MESAPSVNLKEAEELALSLGQALSRGSGEEAAALCQRLAQLCVPVSVSVGSQAYPEDSIRLLVGVEDAQSEDYIPVTVVVSSSMTIAQLKDKFNQDFGFHPSLQRWVIRKRLARDQETLYSHGVRQNGDWVFLFIRSAQTAQLTRHQHHKDQEEQLLEDIVDSMEVNQLLPRGVGAGDAETPPPPPLPKRPAAAKPAVAPKPQLGWSCAMCTYVNKPTRPGCEMCGSERPESYEVPDVYQPDQEETQRMQREKLALLQYEQAQKEERERNYLYLLAAEEQSLIPNAAQAECPICMSGVEPGDGIVLRECLHVFCRDCLKGTIVNSQDAEVSCPDECDSKLLDREIQALLTEEEHQRFLERRLNIAESRSEHSFHCQTPNCRGWCIYEDEVNEFRCELCGETNCILCRAIHKDMNCKDYQDDLRLRAENDQAAQKTKQMLENMLQSGEAMKCPRCDIIVQKKDGCDWLCCLMCKTEICWVTKQARWGPMGRGDTSGGCKCRVNHQPCHPNCQNCH
ncbi:ranBP-type and C3HC4-type zinc finger-containing protein 1 isoform X2 [Betta splendens]|uniref:RanBP-type and C3HC4-type zinc finger-containing protein 1 n=1 Tax=Betta splendens TaxID=158456 RepID=A0A6P7MK80_BETSP|nr:ranBP-type and C3HC4-type zinc finger-containing protein 1 isoform X2 [Betta splendens]XP_029006841.1 ranBP-type and C3HC4-type zinc finger-containing protein 1 isoform X2 [Betta splendens]